MNSKFGIDGCAAQSVAWPASMRGGFECAGERMPPARKPHLLSPVLEGSISFCHEGCFKHAELRN